MWKDIKEIKGLHKGHDIYIIGAGASLNYIDKSFFYNKTTIGINRVHRLLRCQYTFVKDIVTEGGMQWYLNSCTGRGSKLITTDIHGENNELNHYFKNVNGNYYICKVEKWTGFGNTELVTPDSELFVNGHLSIMTAIHVAYYMGAHNIILAGIDGGMIDGELYLKGYYDAEFTPEQLARQRRTYSHPYNEYNLNNLRNALKKQGVNLLSINPFLNLGLEKHVFTRAEIPDNEMWHKEVNKTICNESTDGL